MWPVKVFFIGARAAMASSKSGTSQAIEQMCFILGNCFYSEINC